MKISGALLASLGLLLIGVVYISMSQNIAPRHGEIIMITIATYTFYKITLAIIRAVKKKAVTSPLLVVIRNISYAEVAISVLTLQWAMFVTFGDGSNSYIPTMNMLTGAAVCLFILVLGITMLVKGFKRKDDQRWQKSKLSQLMKK